MYLSQSSRHTAIALLGSLALVATPGHGQTIDDVLAAPIDAGTFAGVVLVRFADGREHLRTVGAAVREFDLPHRRDTRFKFHSLTKPLTSVAVHAAAARGDLVLAASICQYLEPCPAAWRPVQVRHLLNHSSGLPELESDWYSGWQGDLASTYDTLVATRNAFALATPPGTAFRYSNGGYTLLARILEVATGRSITEAMTALVLTPAGMTDAGMEQGPDRSVTPWYGGPVLIPRLANGYNGSPAEVRTAYSLMYTIPGAGGAYGTADDLVAFARAVFQDDLLPAAERTAMATPDTAVHPRYADGWIARDRDGHRAYAHTGGTNGFLSSLEHIPDLDLTVVILSNLGFTDLGTLAGAVADAAVSEATRP